LRRQLGRAEAGRGRWQPGLVNHHRPGEPAAGRATRLSARWRWVADFPVASLRPWSVHLPCGAAEAAPPSRIELVAEAAARPSGPEGLLLAPPPHRLRHRDGLAGTMRPPAPRCGGSGPGIAGAMSVRPAPKSLPVSARSPRRGPAAGCSAAEAVERTPSTWSNPKARFRRGWLGIQRFLSGPEGPALRAFRPAVPVLLASPRGCTSDVRRKLPPTAAWPRCRTSEEERPLAGRVEDRLP